MIPIHQIHQPSHQQTDSDTDSEDDNLNSYIRNRLQQQTQQNNNKHFNISNKLKIIISLCFVSFASLSIYYIHLLSQDQYTGIQTETPNNPNINNSKIAKQIEKINQNNHFDQIKNVTLEEKVQLRNLNRTVEQKNSYFQFENIKKDTTHWYTKRDVLCIPNQIVNTASKISENLFIQKTAYQNINRVVQSAIIPAQNIYSLQPPHQFIKNISISQPQIIVAFDHQDPLLLLLTIPYFVKGIFVSQMYNTPLMQKNLILNDQYLRANFVNRQKLTQNDQYSFLITSDFQLGIKLAMLRKNELIALTNFNEPTAIKSALLMKVKIYKISEGYQCQNRILTILQSPSWRIDETAFLLAGWYVITSPSYTLNLHQQILKYQTTLLKQSKISCNSLAQYTPKSKLLPNNKINITNLPFTELFFYGSESQPQPYLQTAFSFLNNTNWSGPVYLDSGPLEMLLLITAVLPKQILIYLNSSYEQKKNLNKNLVLNSYQKVKILTSNETSSQQFEFIVTTNQIIIQQIKSSKYLLISLNEQRKLQNYIYSQIKHNQCFFNSLQPTSEKNILKGIYIVQKQN